MIEDVGWIKVYNNIINIHNMHIYQIQIMLASWVGTLKTEVVGGKVLVMFVLCNYLKTLRKNRANISKLFILLKDMFCICQIIFYIFKVGL